MAVELTCVIPGGMAKWYSRKDMPPRRERMLSVDLLPLKPLLTKVQSDDFELTREQAADLFALNELAVVCFLKEWTLKDSSGEPLPIPATADDVLDLENRKLYDALVAHAAKLLADVAVDGFGVDSVEDETSPTVALDA
jgi:hypothetical protein